MVTVVFMRCCLNALLLLFIINCLNRQGFNIMAIISVYPAIKSNGDDDTEELVRVFFDADTAHRFKEASNNISILKVSGINTSAPEGYITLIDLRYIIASICEAYGFEAGQLKYHGYIEHVFNAY